MLANVDVPDGPWWVQMLYVAIAAIMSVIASPYLLRKAEEAKARAADATLAARQRLGAMVQEYFLREAANIAEREFPKLAQFVIDHGTTNDKYGIGALKDKLRAWGEDLKQRAIKHFAEQNVDIVVALGDKALDEMIESAANKVSPFPGADTAKTLLQDNVTNWLVEKGVAYAKDKWLKGE